MPGTIKTESSDSARPMNPSERVHLRNTTSAIQPGAILHDRYQVYQRLAVGLSSMVILAKDISASHERFVAIKAREDEKWELVDKLPQLNSPPATGTPNALPGTQNAEIYLDPSFIFHSPGKSYACQVVEPLGRPLSHVLEICLDRRAELNKPESWLGVARPGDYWSIRFAKQACKQILMGLNYYHSQGVAHRDIHPANICLALQHVAPWSSGGNVQEYAWPTEIADSVVPERLDDGLKVERIAQSHDPFRLVLVDLGFASTLDYSAPLPRQWSLAFRPPEGLVGAPVTYKGDIYSLGLLFWNIVMLRKLVESRFLHSDPERIYARNRLLRDLVQRLGPMPTEIRSLWRDGDDFVDSEGTARHPDDEDPWEPDDFEYGDIWYQAKVRKPLDMAEGDMESFVRMILKMLQWQPEKRPTTTELLEDEWFQ
ncbi:kinase-like domain-containing protein [Xylariomycetidae sp. FL2044]|nr:kinase-like domain-containing protein [Xylariomycetidae sp. FL2044]